MIQRIDSSVILDSGLLDKYAQECATPLLGEINPDRALYAAMEKSGMLACFGLFDGDTLIGFATVLVTVYPHWSKKVATMESLFSLRWGTELMAHVKKFAREQGCTTIFYSAPVGGRMEKLLETKKSCERTSSIFGERLD